MSAELTWHTLRWPREVRPEQVGQLMRVLWGAARAPIVIETTGSAGVVTHHLALPAVTAESASDQLRACLPGLAVESLSERPRLTVSRAVELRLTSRWRPLRTEDAAEVGRTVLTALAQTHRSEQATLQWVLARPLAPSAVPNHLNTAATDSWLQALLIAPFRPPRPVDSEVRSAVRRKQGEPGWRVVARVAVRGATPSREHLLARQLLGALSAANAPGIRFTARPTSVRRVQTARAGWRLPLQLNVDELSVVSGLPVGMTGELPVQMLGSRVLPPSRALPRRGRVVADAAFPGRERPLALSDSDGLRHLHALGPSGVGKSTLLMNLIEQDMAAGRAVVVIEPKGDLIEDVLARVRSERLSDVVLIDPTDTARPVGLNPLALHGRSPELVADQVLGLFHSLYAAHWGPRTHDILGASLLTLARTPGLSLAALPLLLTDARFRRQVVAKLNDPIGLEPFWSSFEAWSEAERTTAIAPTLNKLRPLLLRPELRSIVGQTKASFDLTRVFTERKILLVNLQKGLLGPESAALLGSLVISQLWQAVLGRARIAPAARHPVGIYVDEFQDYLHLPVDLADALAQARGLGASFVLAHQYLHQLDPAMRSAVLANAQSRVAFRLGSEDARLIAAGSSLAPEDLQSLGAFECYVQLVAAGAVQPWCSARTRPPSPVRSDPDAVRALSARAFGVDRAAVETELRELFTGRHRGDDLSPRRRGGRP